MALNDIRDHCPTEQHSLKSGQLISLYRLTNNEW